MLVHLVPQNYSFKILSSCELGSQGACFSSTAHLQPLSCQLPFKMSALAFWMLFSSTDMYCIIIQDVRFKLQMNWLNQQQEKEKWNIEKQGVKVKHQCFSEHMFKPTFGLFAKEEKTQHAFNLHCGHKGQQSAKHIFCTFKGPMFHR